MAVAYVAAVGANSGTGAASLSVTMPTVENLDLALLLVDVISGSGDPGNPTTVPSGFALRDDIAGAANVARHAIYSKALNGTEDGATLTVGYAGSQDWSVSLIVLRGALADGSDPLDDSTGRNSGTGTAATWAGVDTAADNEWIVGSVIVRTDQSGGIAIAGGATERTDTSASNAFRNHATFTRLVPTAQTGLAPATASWGTSSYWSTRSVSIKAGTPPITGAANVSVVTAGSAAGTVVKVGAANVSVVTAGSAAGLVRNLAGDTARPDVEYRPGPSPEHLEVIRAGHGGTYVMALELIDAATDTPIYSTAARPADAVMWWAAEPAGRLQFARGRSRQRSLGVQVPIDLTDPESAALVPTGSGHPAHPSTRNRVRVWAGHVIGERTELLPLATLIVDRADLVDTGAVVLDLDTVDPSALADTAFRSGGLRIEAGADTIDTVVAVLTEFLPDMAVILAESAPFTLPAVEKDEGDSVEQFVTDALDSVGMILTVDPFGRYRIEQVPQTWAPSMDPPDWRYGDDGIPVDDVTVGFAVPDAPSGVTVTGGNTNSDEAPAITATVRDQDPSSATWWDVTNPPPSAYTVEVQNEYVVTERQAKVAAWARFRMIGAGGQRVRFSAVPNPALRPDHVVSFGWDRTGIKPGLWIVETVELPIVAGELMRVELARSWDPALEDAEAGDPTTPPPPDPPATVYTESFNWGVADGFIYNRPNWAGNAGSDTVYTKSNQAWGGNGHGLARWTIPMISTDHWSELYIFEIRSDSKGVGPHVRQLGTGIDIQGYQAAAVYAGGSRNKIELRRWDSKYVYQVIGTYTHGSNLELDTIRLEAEGSTLRVKVNGTLALTVVDATHSAGPFIGFVISNAGADNWSGGSL